MDYVEGSHYRIGLLKLPIFPRNVWIRMSPWLAPRSRALKSWNSLPNKNAFVYLRPWPSSTRLIRKVYSKTIILGICLVLLGSLSNWNHSCLCHSTQPKNSKLEAFCKLPWADTLCLCCHTHILGEGCSFMCLPWERTPRNWVSSGLHPMCLFLLLFKYSVTTINFNHE